MVCIGKIMKFNQMANKAIAVKNYGAAAHYLCKLHRLEARDKVGIGAYRVRGI